MAFTLPMLQDGRLGARGGADEPVREPVQIPTAASQGVDYQYSTWYGFLAPAKTPRSVLQTLHNSIVEVAKEPAIASKIRVQGITPADIGLGAGLRRLYP